MHYQILLLAAAAASVCSAQGTMNLTEVIASNSNLSELGALLGKFPSAASAVASFKNVTLFAPDNAAIEALLASPMASNITEQDISALLEYHVLQSVVYASAVTVTPAFLPTELNVTGAGSAVVEASLDNGNVIITSGERQESKVVTANLNYTEGVVHIIDKVLTIPTNVVDTAVAAGLSDFVGAAQMAGLAKKVESLENVTIFAPVNAAFEAIGSAIPGLSQKQLAGILEYHIVQAVAYSTDLKNETLPTVQGNDITITIEDDAVFVNAARVVNANILIAGGVLHVIDSVLNPNNQTAKPDPSATTPTVQFSGASSSSVGVLTTSVPVASSTVSALTATTPTVAATASGSSGGSSSSAGVAAVPTAAIGALALFGGAALLRNW